MKKIIFLLLFTISIFFTLLNSYEIMESIRFSFNLCINNLFPSLIPFMLLSNVLIKYNFINDLSDILSNIMKLFKVNKNCSFIFIMSMLSGSPSNAKYIKDMLNTDLISIEDSINCLNFCHFTNPIFVIGTIGYTFLGNKKIGLIILISHFLSSFIIGLFNKNNIINNYKFENKNDNSFINILKDSIYNTINTLFLILGIITTCIIITTIINNIFKINNNFKFVFGLLEITQGLKYLMNSNFSIEIKSIISSFLISFGGFCIHMQVFSILDNKKIRYYPYFKSRLIHGILSSILTFILINIV